MAKTTRPAVNPLHHVALTVSGPNGDVRIYHCLRHCNRIRLIYWFTLDPAAVDGEARSDMSLQIDARRLPDQFRTGPEPRQWVANAVRAGFDFAAHFAEQEAKLQAETSARLAQRATYDDQPDDYTPF